MLIHLHQEYIWELQINVVLGATVEALLHAEGIGIVIEVPQETIIDIIAVMMTDMTDILHIVPVAITGELHHHAIMKNVDEGDLDLTTVTGSITEKFLNLSLLWNFVLVPVLRLLLVFYTGGVNHEASSMCYFRGVRYVWLKVSI